MATVVTTSEAPAAVDTTIDYLIPTSRINRRFWAPGKELNTGVYQSYPVTIRNARLAPEPLTLDVHGFCLARMPSADHGLPRPGRAEARLSRRGGCDRQGADRLRPGGADGGQLRSPVISGAGIQPPAAEAHVDFDTPTANRIAKAIYDRTAPDGPGYSRFIAFSLWRCFSEPPQDWPLALCEFASIGDDDGVPNVKVDVDEIPEGDALFAPIEGEDEMMAATIFRHNPAHRWCYYPDMSVDEVIFIKFHDSDHSRAWRAPHTAFHDIGRRGAHTRESYEFRALAYFTR